MVELCVWECELLCAIQGIKGSFEAVTEPEPVGKELGIAVDVVKLMLGF